MRALELINCPDPRATVRAAVGATRRLASLAEALAPREIEEPGGQRRTVEPTTAELDGARVHVISITQERRADETVTAPQAVVIVDGERAEEVVELIDGALAARAKATKADHYELPGGAQVVLAGPAIAETGAAPRKARAARLARLEAIKAELSGEVMIVEAEKGIAR
jgi:hypothetical protein